MKIPLKWLGEYVDIAVSPAELIERLTLAGLEVAGTRVFGLPVPDGVRVRPEDVGPEWHRDKIVTANVLKVDQHPNADKLKLVTLEYGAAEPKVVVTGAPNIKVGDAGQVVILALTGSVLFDGHATPKKLMELKPTQLRGVPSDAMVCSGYELGTTEDHEGIILLPPDTPVGRPLADVMGDIVLEVDILPNMARCLGLLGVAREVAALTGAPVRLPVLPADGSGPAIADRVRVSITHPDLSRRYMAFLIEGVTIGDSPLGLQTKLNYAGMRPINNVVDATNFVMLETGQPLHAFDYDVLVRRAGGKPPHITVRPAMPGEVLVTLDKNERKLTAEHLVIADEAGPIALAGVMGGLETEVTAATRNILLEAAHFDFVSIRRTAKAFDLPSEASYRFSRDIHPATAEIAGRRAAHLIAELGAGRVASGVIDCHPAPLPPRVIDLPLREVQRVLGITIAADEATRILTALDFRVEVKGDALRVTTPTTRVDIQDGPADLIEELARIGGYDRLPSTLLADPLPAQLGNPDLDAEEHVRDLLVGYGLQEFVTYALTSPAREQPLGPPAGEYVRLVNPIISDRDCLRKTVLAGVLECVAANLKHTPTVRAFEIGPAFLPGPASSLPEETARLAMVLVGPRSTATWSGPAGPALDFFDLKGLVESLVADLHVTGATIRPAVGVAHLHPGKSAELVVGERVVGQFGELHPKVAEAFDLGRRAVLVAELDLAAMLAAVSPRHAYAPIAKYPAALRDVAVIVPEETPAAAVAQEVRAGGAGLLADVQLFDVYRGESIPPGTKSLAFALSYQAADRTLNDKEVDKAHQKIEARLKHVLKASIRGKE